MEVYSPKNLTAESAVRNIAKKKRQAAKFLVQEDFSEGKMQEIGSRVFGRPDCKRIDLIFFNPKENKIFFYQKTK